MTPCISDSNLDLRHSAGNSQPLVKAKYRRNRTTIKIMDIAVKEKCASGLLFSFGKRKMLGCTLPSAHMWRSAASHLLSELLLCSFEPSQQWSLGETWPVPA